MPYIKVKRGPTKVCVYKKGDDGRPVGDTLGCHEGKTLEEAEKKAQNQIEAIYAEEGRQAARQMVDGGAMGIIAETWNEFKGRPPEVQYADGVDVDTLTSGDDDPMFITLSVGEVDAQSRNGLRWTPDFANEVVKQINERRPTGIMGHIKEGDEDTAFPLPVLHWLGAGLFDKTVWAKGYVVPGPAKEYIRRQKAAGGKIATSIYGRGARQYQDDGSFTMTGLSLEQVDLAPFERAALQTSGEFYVTAEMASHDDDEEGESMEITREQVEQVIREMQAADAALIPKAVKEAVLQEMKASGAVQRVAELETELGKAKADGQKAADRVSELEKESARLSAELLVFRETDFQAHLKARVAETVKLEALRPAVERIVLAEVGQEREKDKLDEALKAYLDSDEYKRIAETMLKAVGGPDAGERRDGQDGGVRKIEDTPEARQKARSILGL